MENPDKTNLSKKDTDSTNTSNPITDPTNVAKSTKPDESYAFTNNFEEATKSYKASDENFKRPLFGKDYTSKEGDVNKILGPLKDSLTEWTKNQKGDYVKHVNQKFESIKNEIEEELNKYNKHYKIMDGKDKVEALRSLQDSLLEKVKHLLDKTKEDFINDQEAVKAIDNLKSLQKIEAINELFTNEIVEQARDEEKLAKQRSVILINKLNPETGVTVSNQKTGPTELPQGQNSYRIIQAEERSPWKQFVNKIMDKSIYAKIDKDFIFLESRPQKFWNSEEGRLAIRRQLLLRIAKKGFGFDADAPPLTLEAFNALKKPQPNKKVLAIMFEEAVKLGFDPKKIKSDGFTPEQAWLDKLNEEVKQNRVHSEYSNIKAIDNIEKELNIDKEFNTKEMSNISNDLENLKKPPEMSNEIDDDKDNTKINEIIQKLTNKSSVLESYLDKLNELVGKPDQSTDLKKFYETHLDKVEKNYYEPLNDATTKLSNTLNSQPENQKLKELRTKLNELQPKLEEIKVRIQGSQAITIRPE